MQSQKLLMILVYLLTGLSTLLQLGCTQGRIYSTHEEAQKVFGQGGFCTRSPDAVEGPVKFLFIIDKSESNVNCDEPGPCGALAAQHTGTDPLNHRRADNIEKFFNGIGKKGIPRNQDDNIYWGYIAFSTYAKAFINDGNENNPIFVGTKDNPDDITRMAQALGQQRGPDQGGTKYLAALALANKAITEDIKKTGNMDSNYVLFFMTDGLPDDFGASQPASQQHLDAVDQLMKVDPGHIRLSTGFYGPPEIAAGASDGLRKMAEHGAGRFVDLNVDDNFFIDDFLIANRGAIPYRLKAFNSFFVYNTNASLCFDNEWGVDSDGDGLCDRDEVELTQKGIGKFDPGNRFSFGDGYSDYIHYYAVMTGDNLPSCSDRTDVDGDLLTACEENYMRNLSTNNFLGRTSADDKNPDTDGDGIIDGIEYLTLKNRSAAVDPTNLLQRYDTDFENAFLQIFMHHNPLYPDHLLTNKDTYEIGLVPTGYDATGATCYNFSQEKLGLYYGTAGEMDKVLPGYEHSDTENVVLVYYLEVPENDPYAKGVYRSAKVKMDITSNAPLKISDSLFSTYIPPKQESTTPP